MLKDVLRPDLYQHFLALSLACSILVSPVLAQRYLPFAKELLCYFVKEGHELYGKEFLVYNVHCLLHICDDVMGFCSLDQISAFPFENYMQMLKKLARSGRNPAVQIARRISEIPPVQHVSKDMKIYFKQPNNSYILTGDKCCEARRSTAEKDSEGNKLVMCRVCPNPEPLSTSPWDTRIIGAFRVNWSHSHMKLVPENELTRRALMMDKGSNRSIFLAILHM